MIISKTPYRISFFGGGTDFPKWYLENEGEVLSTSIDKYCYISCRVLPPFFQHKHRFVYSIIEDVLSNQDIQHPAIRGVFNWLKIDKGMEIHHDGDLPARAGLGSSSSFTVGLLNALRAQNNGIYSKNELARDAIYVEQKVIGENVGSQDQIAASYGGFNHIKFGSHEDFKVSPVIISPDNKKLLNDHLLLFFTGIQRVASEIEESKLKKMKENSTALSDIQGMVQESLGIISRTDIKFNEFGELLYESWKLKKTLSSLVTNSKIDNAFQTAIDSGAIGGKILGAGGGGFLLLFAEPHNHSSIKKKLSKLVHVPFSFDQLGSSIALYQPSGL